MKTLLISTIATPQVALIDDGRLCQWRIFDQKNANVGDIYLGVVVRVVTGMDACFVDIGRERTALLHKNDIFRADKDTPIHRLVHQGERLLVQVIKDEIATKGARLTTDISLASRYVVYRPFSKTSVSVSHRMDKSARQRLRTALTAFTQNLQGAWTARTASESVDEKILSDNIYYLYQRWQTVLDAKTSTKTPSLIQPDLSFATACVREMADDVAVVKVDDEATYRQICAFCESTMPNFLSRIIYEPMLVVDDVWRVGRKTAMSRRVDLPSGGYLLFDETEALTVIDVNTGSATARTPTELSYRTNLEAVHAIAHQLRLRNISGIVVVDFIDVHTSHQKAIFAELSQATSQDIAKITISPIGAFGLLTLARERTHGGLLDTLYQPCHVCDGTGKLPTHEAVAFELLADILSHHKKHPSSTLTVMAEPSLAEFLTDHQAIFDLSKLLDIALTIVPNHQYGWGKYALKV